MLECEDIFNQLNIMGYLKTIEMMPLVTTGRFATKEQERSCSTCGNYIGKLNCRILGKIKNPNCIYCSWWEEGNKNEKYVIDVYVIVVVIPVVKD